MKETIKQSRLDGLISQAEYYLYMRYDNDNCKFSSSQKSHIREIISMLPCFGEAGGMIAEELKTIL